MCGIVGILAHQTAIAPGLLERATNSLAHRGPDDSGTIVIRDIFPEPVEAGLGCRRLAILDRSPRGHQPMQDSESGNWIVHNGEIYNFREIRGELEQSGVRLQSGSDTEVLLKAYGRWGEDCLRKLRGMFAFAIWDAQRHRLFVARDPMGIKPLYYCTSGQYFLFASELRTLLGTGLVPRRLDQAGLLSYLAFGSAYDPNTLIKGISALRPGHYLIWEKGDLREVAYWDLAQEPPDSGLDTASSEQRQQNIDQVHAAIDQSVRAQMVSDVPVGLFLSGGIDSSCVAGILSRNGYHPSTFSIVFREADYSEAEYSRTVARTFGTDHHEILVSQQDALDVIPSALEAMDQPTIDGINTYLISQKTRAAGIKVALSGLGGDELFAGYSSFRTVPRMERFADFWRHVPGAIRRSSATAFALIAPHTDRNQKLADLARENGRLLHPYFIFRALFTSGQWDDLLASSDLPAIGRMQSPLEQCLSRSRCLDPINRVSYLESRCYMANMLLRDADVMSMAHGLEVRVPLIDHHLAEMVFALPGSWKLERFTPKPILVSALGGSLPREIVHRRKRGFTLPWEHWLRGELRAEVERTLQKSADGPLSTILKAPAILAVWDNFLRGRTSWSRLWSLFVLHRWCEINSVAT